MSSSASAAAADPGWGAPVPPRVEVAAAASGVRGLSDRSFWSLPTSEVRGCLEEVAVLKAVTAELELRLVAEADRRRDGARPGGDSAALGGQPRLEPGQVKRQVRLARAFDRGHCTPTRDALAAGKANLALGPEPLLLIPPLDRLIAALPVAKPFRVRSHPRGRALAVPRQESRPATPDRHRWCAG